MRWFLWEGSRQLVLSTERARSAEGTAVQPERRVAISSLRSLAENPHNMRALRLVHIELVGGQYARTRADAVIVAEVMGLLASRRLYLVEDRASVVPNVEVPQAPEDELWEHARSLVAEQPPPPPPELAPSMAVIAQAAALKQAAASGAAFCEE